MIRKFAIAAAMVLAGASAAHAKVRTADGYFFHVKEFERTKPNINIVVYPDMESLAAAARKYSAVTYSNYGVAAFSLIKPDGCEIHMIDPAVAYKPEFIGHEFLHCVYGRWHPSNKPDVNIQFLNQ